jgi:hypothetical protein
VPVRAQTMRELVAEQQNDRRRAQRRRRGALAASGLPLLRHVEQRATTLARAGLDSHEADPPRPPCSSLTLPDRLDHP